MNLLLTSRFSLIALALVVGLSTLDRSEASPSKMVGLDQVVEDLARDNLLAPEGEETATVIFEVLPDDVAVTPEATPDGGKRRRRRGRGITPPSPELRELVDARPVAGTVVEVVPLEPKHSMTAINAFVATTQGQVSAGLGLAVKLRPWLIGDANLGFQTVSAKDRLPLTENQSPPSSQFVAQVTSSLRVALLKDRVQVGVAYQGINKSKLVPTYGQDIRSVGYTVRVNLLQFSDGHGTGNRLYLMVSGFKKNLAPNLVGVAMHWNLGNH